MKKEILNTYLKRQGLATSSVEVFYSFTSGTSDVTWNDVYTKDEHYCNGNLLADKYPGLSIGYTDTPSDGIVGSGYFTRNDTLRIGSGIGDNQWATFLDFGNHNCNILNQNLNTAEILLSSMTDSTAVSGFNLGLNNTNKLFLEYNNQDEKVIKTLNHELSNYNVVSLSYDGLLNELSLSYHDFPNGVHENISFPATNYLHSNVWYLGGTFTSQAGYTGYSGYFDDFLFFNKPVDTTTRNNFSEAFFVDQVIPATTSTTSGYRDLPANLTINPTGVISVGITGYTCAPFMNVEQKVGSDITLYKTQGITGAITGTTFEFVSSGSGLFPIASLVPEQIVYNAGEMQRHSKQYVKFTETPGADDIYEFYLFQKPKTNLKRRADFNVSRNINQLNNTYLDGTNINLYTNGVSQVSGSNYSVDELNILSDGRYDFEDHVSYDKIGGATTTFDFPGNSSNYYITNESLTDEDIYLNGQKLISGADYSIDGSQIDLWPGLPEGELSFMARAKDITLMVTGNSSTKVKTNSIDELVWVNGVKQVENMDYFKVNECSLFDPTKKIKKQTYSIYNNNGKYFNI